MAKKIKLQASDIRFGSLQPPNTHRPVVADSVARNAS